MSGIPYGYGAFAAVGKIMRMGLPSLCSDLDRLGDHALLCPFRHRQEYSDIQVKIYVPRTTFTIEEWLTSSHTLACAVFRNRSSTRQTSE